MTTRRKFFKLMAGAAAFPYLPSVSAAHSITLPPGIPNGHDFAIVGMDHHFVWVGRREPDGPDGKRRVRFTRERREGPDPAPNARGIEVRLTETDVQVFPWV